MDSDKTREEIYFMAQKGHVTDNLKLTNNAKIKALYEMINQELPGSSRQTFYE
jgi:hypothetical protein